MRLFSHYERSEKLYYEKNVDLFELVIHFVQYDKSMRKTLSE